MKRQLITLTFFLIVILQNVNSQTSFPTLSDNPTWSVYGSENVWGGFYTNILAYQYDTNFCGYNYLKLEGAPTSLIGYVRIANEKVYVRKSNNCSDKEYLMYDFSLHIGDTVYCGHNISDTTMVKDTTIYWVTNVDSVTFFDVKRKRLRMNYYLGEPPWGVIRQMDWIEGMGSLIHPFFPLVCLIDYCETAYILLCYDSAGTQLYQHPDFTTCNTNVGIEELNNHLDFTIKPNPFSQYTTIEIGQINSDKIQIQIYTIDGIKLYDYTTYKENRSIKIGNQLTSGIYFVKLLTDKQKVVKKIIKN